MPCLVHEEGHLLLILLVFPHKRAADRQMILRKYTVFLAALLCFAYATPAVADTDWASGTSAFLAGDFSAALLYFEAARDGGLAGPAVHYNIAVCQFELADYANARDTFQLIAQRFPEMRGLAEYNIGLAERRQGNVLAAQRNFVSAYRHTDDEKIKALAASQITELDNAIPAGWYGSVGTRLGYDDNVALRDSLGLPAGVSAESPMADLYANIRAPLPGISGLAADGSLYLVTYPDADDFDQTEIRLGIVHDWHGGDWRIGSGIYRVIGTLGGSGFNEETGLDVRTTRYLGDESSLEFRLRYDEIRGASSSFDGIDGSRSRVDLAYRRYGAVHDLSVRLGIETNNRFDPFVSPTRQGARVDYRYRFSEVWDVDSSLSIRNSKYDDISIPRSEDLISASLGVTRSFGDIWLINATYQYSKNDSSDPVFSYDRNQLSAGFLRLF